MIVEFFFSLIRLLQANIKKWGNGYFIWFYSFNYTLLKTVNFCSFYAGKIYKDLLFLAQYYRRYSIYNACLCQYVMMLNGGTVGNCTKCSVVWDKAAVIYMSFASVQCSSASYYAAHQAYVISSATYYTDLGSERRE